MGDVVPIHPKAPAPAEPLWREAVGERLRRRRSEREERLVDVAGRAGVSPQYLSEVERGLKDPSSELLAAICGALDLSVGALAGGVHDDLRSRRTPTQQPSGPVCLAA